MKKYILFIFIILIFGCASDPEIIKKMIPVKEDNKEVKNITIIRTNGNTTVGATGRYAFGDNVRPKEILRKIFRQLSMNKETPTSGKESPSFRKE